MSKRRDLLQHIASLSDIEELLDAMQGLALVESRRIAQFIDAQRAVVDIVATTLTEFLQDHPHLQQPPGPGEVLCIIGSQRGFCGDLNAQLIEAAGEDGMTQVGSPVILVGERLIDAWPASYRAAAVSLPGASFADEVAAVLVNLSAAITAVMGHSPDKHPPAVTLLYADASGVRRRGLFPAASAASSRTRQQALMLNLPPEAFHRALLEQYLEVTLSSVLYEALLHENEQRLQHMKQASKRTEEKMSELSRRANRARQEEIINEIEVLLISDLAANTV